MNSYKNLLAYTSPTYFSTLSDYSLPSSHFCLGVTLFILTLNVILLNRELYKWVTAMSFAVMTTVVVQT